MSGMISKNSLRRRMLNINLLFVLIIMICVKERLFLGGKKIAL